MHKLQGDKDLSECTDLLLGDPLYNIRRQLDLQHRDHEVFDKKEMEESGTFGEYVLDRRGHRHVSSLAVEIAVGGDAFTLVWKRWGTEFVKKNI